MTNGELIDAYVANMRLRGLSPRTLTRRLHSLRAFSTYIAIPFASVRVEHIEGFLAQFPHPNTRRPFRSDIAQMYKFLVARDHVAGDPCLNVPSVRVPKRAPSPIAGGEVVRVIDAAVGPERLMVMLAAFAGLRVSEIGRLRGEDVDLASRVLVVRQGKGGRDDTVPISDELAAELAHYPARGYYFPKPNVGKRGNDPAPYVTGKAVGTRIRRLFRRVGVEGRPHDLRHSYGTTAARRSDGNLRLVQRLMRHATLASTELYIDYTPPGAGIVTGLYVVAEGHGVTTTAARLVGEAERALQALHGELAASTAELTMQLRADPRFVDEARERLATLEWCQDRLEGTLQRLVGRNGDRLDCVASDGVWNALGQMLNASLLGREFDELVDVG